MRRSTEIIACLILYVCCYSAPTVFALPTGTVTVDLGYARYQGVPFLDPITNITNTQFLGIRYAAAPTGSGRFKRPQPPSYIPGVQLANEQPSQCMQSGGGTAPKTPFRNISSTSLDTSSQTSVNSSVSQGSEDCLFLNVNIPGQIIPNQKLPVVVWIHGGGYVLGNASSFDGNDLVREAGGGVIAVLIQYRLGLFGFLPGEKVKQGGALNAGLLDQQAAFQWVQEHISKFGGDPAKVTLWGESAGAGSVIQHVVANGGNTSPPLFRAAITSSTGLPSQYHYNDPIPEFVYSQVVNQTGCSSSNDTLECLRAADVNSLQCANLDISSSAFFGTFVFQPVVDGSFITERPTQLLKAGKLNGDILLSVTNAFEGTFFVDQSTVNTVQVADYVSQLFPNFGPEQSNAAAAQYAGLGTNIFQAVAIMGESIFICPTYFLLRAFDGRAYKGEFAVPPAFHGQDITSYFPDYQPPDFSFMVSGKGTTNNTSRRSFQSSRMTLESLNGASPKLSNEATSIPDVRLVTKSSVLLERREANNLNNATMFATSFSESFLNFVMTLNTTLKWDPSDITPNWELWNPNSTVEMLFNVTESGAADIHSVTTSSALLERCEFWESVSAFSAQ